MAGLISQAKKTTGTLKKAGDAKHDPADLGSKPGAKLLDIPISELGYNPRNVRDEDLEADPETVELANSMVLLGQQQSAVVVLRETFLTKYPEEASKVSKPWVVMIGNRRRAGAKLNGWKTLECIVRDRVTENLDQLADLPIHENLHRKGINPLRMAYYLADQKKILGSERAVAEKVGKTQPWVNQMLKLLKLIPELQALVKSNELNAATGRTLAKLDHQEQREIWEQVAGLDADERADFWSSGAWRDKSFIAPVAEENSREASESESDSAGDAAASMTKNESEPRTAREKPAIVIRLMDRSPMLLAAALRENLSENEVQELVQALNA